VARKVKPARYQLCLNGFTDEPAQVHPVTAHNSYQVIVWDERAKVDLLLPTPNIKLPLSAYKEVGRGLD